MNRADKVRLAVRIRRFLKNQEVNSADISAQELVELLLDRGQGDSEDDDE